MTTDWECPGEGKCHGCVSWCDRCGNVDITCHAETCDRHRCRMCNVRFTHEERDFNYQMYNDSSFGECTNCHRQMEIERLERAMLDCNIRADYPWESHDRDNWLKAAEVYGEHMKRLIAGEWP